MARLAVLARMHGRTVESEVRWILRAHVTDPGRLEDRIGTNDNPDRFDSFIAGEDLTAGVTFHEKEKT